MRERLQKIIAAAGLASRRTAESWIEAGRVTVNGRPAQLGDQADPQRDTIALDGKPLRQAPQAAYVLLHKPAGVVTTRHDPQGRPTVLSLLDPASRHLFPVGRLDLNSEGLLLLTNDGALAQALTHPRYEVPKTYLVRVRGLLGDEARHRLEEGVELPDGRTAPARIEHVRSTRSHTWFEITVREGRNRLVRRMCEQVGHPVARLIRVRMGFLELGALRPGSWRNLTPAEVRRLKSEAGVTP